MRCRFEQNAPKELRGGVLLGVPKLPHAAGELGQDPRHQRRPRAEEGAVLRVHHGLLDPMVAFCV